MLRNLFHRFLEDFLKSIFRKKAFESLNAQGLNTDFDGMLL